MMKSIMAIGTVVLLAAPVAMAQQRSAGVCVADIKAKCAGVEPGEGRIIACVKTHAAEFSEPCKARLARVAEITKACAADIKENCAGKEKSRGKCPGLHPENYWQHQERPMQGGARAGRGWKKIKSSNAAGSKIAIRPLFAGVALEMTAQRRLLRCWCQYLL